MIDVRLLVQRHAHAEYDATHHLAARGLRIENAPGRHRIDDAGHAHDAELFVDSHFGEHRGMRIARALAVVVRLGFCLLVEPIELGVAHHIRHRNARRIVRRHELAVAQCDIAEFHAGERRILHLLREPQQLLAQLLGRRSDRACH